MFSIVKSVTGVGLMRLLCLFFLSTVLFANEEVPAKKIDGTTLILDRIGFTGFAPRSWVWKKSRDFDGIAYEARTSGKDFPTLLVVVLQLEHGKEMNKATVEEFEVGMRQAIGGGDQRFNIEIDDFVYSRTNTPVEGSYDIQFNFGNVYATVYGGGTFFAHGKYGIAILYMDVNAYSPNIVKDFLAEAVLYDPILPVKESKTKARLLILLILSLIGLATLGVCLWINKAEERLVAHPVWAVAIPGGLYFIFVIVNRGPFEAGRLFVGYVVIAVVGFIIFQQRADKEAEAAAAEKKGSPTRTGLYRSDPVSDRDPSQKDLTDLRKQVAAHGEDEALWQRYLRAALDAESEKDAHRAAQVLITAAIKERRIEDAFKLWGDLEYEAISVNLRPAVVLKLASALNKEGMFDASGKVLEALTHDPNLTALQIMAALQLALDYRDDLAPALVKDLAEKSDLDQVNPEQFRALQER